MPADDRNSPDRPEVLVALPGTGSDADFVRRAFGPTAADLGIELIGLQPTDDLIDGYRRRLTDIADQRGSILVGGVSIGAAVTVEWALGAGAGRCAGVWAALPAWSGPATTAVAAASARATAQALRADGLDATVAAMAQGSPTWLADELGRSWRALHPGLVVQLEQAAAYRAPTVAEIAGLTVPLGIVAAADDPLHPIDVARAWADAAAHASLAEVTLTAWGEQPELLGRACARAWQSVRTTTAG
ncbi:alpha/beta hydrolase [Gordonia sp. NB41Y]|uniref:alpha/beta hydrolase n=1 Tax=Gordonia sp. NB41Y TaxID=875808 RepID=UPI0006B20A8E|nr:alpha/beta hydrolase [Gordonia sp. NB41Y]KOY49930.1 alpha/beta hydrolase [Gordonia sp. NB41Y]WLP91071.1 alpha/beta hydrolase [Gordonia sp. NB41Y]